MIALDASAVLAFLFVEPGQDRVAELLDGGLLSAVNLSETLARVLRDGRDAAVAEATLRDLGVRFVPFTREQAGRTASLVEPTRSRGLSLADRACLALALERGLPALTADRAWTGLDVGVEIRLIR